MEQTVISRDVFFEMLQSFAASVVALLPKIAVALLLLLVGILAAKIIEAMLRRLFVRLDVEPFLQRSGAAAMVQKIGWAHPVCRLLERTVFFLVLILFLQQAAMVMGFKPLTDFITTSLHYVPRVLMALVIVLAGSLLANVAGRVVAAGARSVGVEFAAVLGRLASGATVAVAFLMAFHHLQIDSFLPQWMVLGAFLGLVFAIALTFGLGSRELSRNILAGSYARRVFEPGSEIEIGGERGILHAITPLQTLIRQGDGYVALPNSVFLEEKIRT